MLNKDFLKENAEIFAFLTIACFCLAVYGQVVSFEFINTDDNLYVYENPKVLSGLTLEAIYWAFTAFHAANWHPLTWISHQLDVSLFGSNAGAHHATNVIFHLLNSFLAFMLFRRLLGDYWKAFFVSLLFAIHPTHVESVAWISERKDVLSTMFWILTMLAYLNYSQAKTRVYVHYALMVLLFVLGLMSKPMLVTLPFVLLLCDYWPLERLRTLQDLPKLVIEKLPLFVLTGISSYITFLAQSSAGAVQAFEALPLTTRIFNAVIAYVKYIFMMFYPVNLGLQYGYDNVISPWKVIGALVFLVTVSFFCLWQARSRKYLIIGWLWFLGTLVPVIGLVQVGAQSMADRYTYIPYFGLFIMLVCGLGELAEKFHLQKTVVAAGFIACLALSVLCFRQVSYWRDSETLYRHSITVVGESFLIAHNLCHTLFFKNELEEATQYCLKSIVWNRYFDRTYSLLGLISVKQNRPEQALNYLSMALELNPHDPVNYLNLANALFILGRSDEAEEKLTKFVELMKRDQSKIDFNILLRAYSDVGLAYFKNKENEKAIRLYGRLVGSFPDNLEIRLNYAIMLFASGQLDEADKQISFIIEKSPTYAEAYNIRGLILAAKGKIEEAKQQLEKAIQINPNLESAKRNLETLKNLAGERK